MQSALIDAGPLIALFNRSDKYHKALMEFLPSYKGFLFTTWPVITEVMHMINFNVEVQADLLKWISQQGLRILEIDMDDIERLIELLLKYSDLPMDLADGSLILSAEKFNIHDIITIDSDYYVYRLKDKKYFRNLLQKFL